MQKSHRGTVCQEHYTQGYEERRARTVDEEVAICNHALMKVIGENVRGDRRAKVERERD